MALSIQLTVALLTLFVVQIEGLSSRVIRDEESSHSSDLSIKPKMLSDFKTNNGIKNNTTISKIILDDDDDDAPFILGGDLAKEDQWKFMVNKN